MVFDYAMTFNFPFFWFCFFWFLRDSFESQGVPAESWLSHKVFLSRLESCNNSLLLELFINGARGTLNWSSRMPYVIRVDRVKKNC